MLVSLPVDKNHRSASVPSFPIKSITIHQRHNRRWSKCDTTLSLLSAFWRSVVLNGTHLPTRHLSPSVAAGPHHVASTWAPPAIPGGPSSSDPVRIHDGVSAPSGWDRWPVSSILLSAAPADWCILHLCTTSPVRYGNEDVWRGWWKGWWQSRKLEIRAAGSTHGSDNIRS